MGEGNDFSPRGVDADGPKITGGMITFSFQEKPNFVSNHKQVNVPTLPFDELPSCAKKELRKAFIELSNAANIQFEEQPNDSDSNIKIFVADITTRGIGNPRYTLSQCHQLSDHLILSPNYTSDCNVFYLYVLHELGHVIGLGHSSTDNIIGDISTTFEGLQAGDIKGLIEIYGE